MTIRLLRKLFPQIRRRTVTYGTRRGSDFHIKLAKSTFDRAEHRPTSHFHVTYGERDLGEFRLHVPGVHNVLNATAAIAVGIGLDIKADDIRAGAGKLPRRGPAISSCGAKPPASA